MDSAHWPQVVVKSMEEEEGRRPVSERRAKPAKDQILNCPRCNSNNTKFCYYNNYSLSQPRYFCKSCRRYWTAGGSLRNIPVGGASRKNKRPALSPAPSTSSSAKKNDAQPPPNPIINTSSPSNINTTSSPCWTLSDHMDQMLKTGMSPRELIPFMPMPAPQPSSMCSTAADCDPSSRNINGFEGAAGEARSLLTVEEFKQLPSIIADQNGGKLGDVAGFWNGIFGGGSW